MEKALSGLVGLVLLAVVAVVAGLGYLVYRLAENTVTTIDRTWGAAFYQIGGAAALFAFVLVVIGGAMALVQWMARRSRYVHAKDGMFPVENAGRGRFYNPNEAGAQSLAVMTAAGKRPTAALASRVIDAHYSTRDAEPAALPEPEPVDGGRFPQQAAIYSAPMPRDLALPVGIDGAGRPVALPLRNLGNVLVAGLPGSGKSELLASMLAGLLRQDASGQRVQVATVDTKLVTFGNMPALPGLWSAPALEIEDAHALVWRMVEEVRRRFELLLAARVRSVEEYRQRTGETLPYLVTVIDELADLTSDHDRRRAAVFNAAAMEIGRKGRAAGVALVMATQRPSVDVIPSSLRNLAGAAVCFRVNRNHDSIAVLGEAGAELLPAVPGRCLVKRSDTRPAQAYMAGLEGGQFDRFLLDLPQLTRGADGIPVNNWPTTDGAEAVEAVVDGSGPVVQRLQPGREPDPQLAAQLRRLHADGWSKTSLCNAAWGYKDGVVWGILDRVLVGS